MLYCKENGFTCAVQSVAVESISARATEAAWCVYAVCVHTASSMIDLTLVEVCTQSASAHYVNDTYGGPKGKPLSPVYTIQPVVKPVEQPVEQPVAWCKQTD